MKLTDVDAFRERWNVSERCEDCKQDARYCGADLYDSNLYSLRDICNSIDDAPIIDAIPMEWIEWRIAHAEREGFGAVVSMLRTVRDWWNDQRDVWQKEQEAR